MTKTDCVLLHLESSEDHYIYILTKEQADIIKNSEAEDFCTAFHTQEFSRTVPCYGEYSQIANYIKSHGLEIVDELYGDQY